MACVFEPMKFFKEEDLFGKLNIVDYKKHDNVKALNLSCIKTLLNHEKHCHFTSWLEVCQNQKIISTYDNDNEIRVWNNNSAE